MNQQLSAPRPQPEIEPPQAGCPDSKIIEKKGSPRSSCCRYNARINDVYTMPWHGKSHVGSETATLKPA